MSSSLIIYKFMKKSHSISLASVPTTISPRKSADTHRGWQDVLLLFWVRTNVTCFLSNRTIYLALALAKQIDTLCHSHCVLRFANPNALLAILPSACILKGNFLLLRIDRMSFAYHGSNSPKPRSSSLRSCGAKSVGENINTISHFPEKSTNVNLI